MTRNKSLLLIGIFFLVALIFGNLFWRMFDGGNDEVLEKIREKTEENLKKNRKLSSTVPAAENTQMPTNVNSSGVPADSQTNTLENSNPLPTDSQKTPNNEIENLPAEEEDATADWEIYVDEKKAFEFKHPIEAIVVLSGDLIRIKQADKTWKIRKYSNEEKLELSRWYAEEFSESERKNCALASQSVLKVAEYETQYANPNSGETECKKAGYFSISKDKKYVIRVELGDETTENVNKILATFKFKE